MELFERIRRDRREEAMSIRGLARRHEAHRRTVRQALTDAVPPGRKTPQRGSPVLGPYREVIRGWLAADEALPRKQRHTAHRVWERLVAEYDATVAESTVRGFVAQLKAESRTGLAVATVPQTHLPGGEAEVDFGEVHAWVAGVLERRRRRRRSTNRRQVDLVRNAGATLCPDTRGLAPGIEVTTRAVSDNWGRLARW